MICKIDALSAIAHQYVQMHHLYKGTAKNYPRKPGFILRPFRPDRALPYAQQLAAWQAGRMQIKEVGRKAKEDRKPGSYRVSVREKKNLESSLGRYWGF
jgi:hypothetical protein